MLASAILWVVCAGIALNTCNCPRHCLRDFRPELRQTVSMTTAVLTVIVFTLEFDWGSLPAGSVVVDVGGGIGNVTMDLAVRHSHLRFVVQDLPAVISQAHQVRLLNRNILQQRWY